MTPPLIRRVGAALIGCGWALACAQGIAPARAPLIVAPTIEGILLCDEAAAAPEAIGTVEAQALCAQRGSDRSAAVMRLLDTLEPGGPAGQVQVGYTLTVQLLALYRRAGDGWEIDPARVDAILNVITRIKRPVVLYLAANQFDSLGPLAAHLRADPRNLMHLAGGAPLKLDYFGYPIVPYTLRADGDIPVNRYRFAALEEVARRVLALPEAVRGRIVAWTLAGELHQMFPDFENGMGRFGAIQVTDYSPESVAGFRDWLQRKYRTIARFNRHGGFDFTSFDEIPAPSRDIRVQPLRSFAEHYDSFAGGTLPVAGWLWDPEQRIDRLELYVDGKLAGPVATGFNRLDVYRAVDEITSPNTGFRHDLDFRALRYGRHRLQVVAVAQGARHELAEVDFVVPRRDQRPIGVARSRSARLRGLKPAADLPGVRFFLDMPHDWIDVYYNPLARDWNDWRKQQVVDFATAFYHRARAAGVPSDRIFSHQIVPQVNSSWNVILFAVDDTLLGSTPWRQGINLYGGATESAWLRQWMRNRGIADYGVPEFNPQQWKTPGVHLSALESHYDAGARFVSPYYFSVASDKFLEPGEQGVNRMEIRPENMKDGSDQFYEALIEFARR